MTHALMRVAVVCAFIALFGRSSSAEEVVLVPPGTYSLAEILTRSGTPANWIRYKPLHGGVVIRGGGSVDRQFVILDGFLFDGNLHPQAPTRTGALNVAASNVRIENSELRGPKDIHTGYNALDQRSCGESDGFPNGGGGLGVDGQNVVFDNIVLHGFYSSGIFRKGSTVRIKNSLIRNNFNGFTFQGTFAEVRDSVLWVHPNHLNSTNTPGGTLHLINNLIVDAQEANMIWCQDCVFKLVLIHNTVYIPANRLCGEMQGFKTAMVKDEVIVRDNIVVNTQSPYVGAAPETRSSTNDYNMFFQHRRGSDEFRYGPRTGDKNRVSRAQWLNMGRDRHSIFDALPRFRNPPAYEDFSANQWGFRVPRSAAEAREWFYLDTEGPGVRSASDKRDMGISRTSILPETPLPSSGSTPRTPSAPQGLTIE